MFNSVFNRNVRVRTLALVALLVPAACNSTVYTLSPGVPVVSVAVRFEQPTVLVGQSTKAIAIAKDQNHNTIDGRKLRWISLSPGIAFIHPSTGEIMGKAPGTAIIRATVDETDGEATLVVVTSSHQ